MTLNEYFELDKNSRLSKSDLAEKIGVTSAMISQWLSGDRPISPKKCNLIFLATKGQVTREGMRPFDHKEIWPRLRKSA